ncbi:MAG: NUDIX hydrolase, partial [Methyloceanibacter sp.]
ILLVTSRGTGRWIVPKGWPIEGLDSPATALQEAWEEAGVRCGKPSLKPLGSYHYEKGLPGDWSVPVTTIVYPVRVLELSSEYPESDQRTRKWVSPSEAAELVDEPELKELLAFF